jgi:hypothetical protein
MRRLRLALSVIAAVPALLAVRASADDHPALFPSRDATVTYERLADGSRPSDQAESASIQVSFGDKGQRLRIEPAGRPTYMLVDRSEKKLVVVMPQRRLYMELPWDLSKFLNFGQQDAQFSRRGHATVAGLSCTEYSVHTAHGDGTTCLTDDGLLLRAQGSKQRHDAGLQATNVRFAPQPASTFQPPPDFQRVEMPRLPPADGAPGAPGSSD